MPTTISKRNGANTKRAFSKSSARLTEREVVTRNLELATEFSRYLIEHPAFAEKLPQNAEIFFMPSDDPLLCKANARLVEMEKRQGRVRSIVVIRFAKLAPSKSRMIQPRVDKGFVASAGR